MTLRSALDDYKRQRNHPRQFPGERRSTTGTFSGLDERLVYVDRQGWHRDYTYALSGLAGVERSRFGLAIDGETTWLDQVATTGQRYVDDTTMVETTHDAGSVVVTQRDLTVGATHCSRFTVEGSFDTPPTLQAFFDLNPEKQESRLGKLEHDGAVEVHHQSQYNLVAASTAIGSVSGQLPEQFAELATYDETVDYPRASAGGEKYEDALLNGTVVLEIPLERVEPGRAAATVVSLLADTAETPRPQGLEAVRAAAERHGDPAALEQTAREQVAVDVPEDAPRRELAVSDLRVLALLAADSGAHIAGPDPDPFYVYSGGYGYTWFRDDAEIARYLLETDQRLDLGLAAEAADSAAFYIETQLADGSWPHRVWAHNGAVAPGWAHARLEADEDIDYQADQTASVLSFLAAYLRLGEPDDPGAIEAALQRAVESLDETVEDDGLPIVCQNAWENMHGRFLHTAATFLKGYAALARAPVGEALRERAHAGAEAVYEGLEHLWLSETGHYALRETPEGELDERLDSGSFALAEAHREYAALATVDPTRRERLQSHFAATVEGLFRESEAVSGLIRFEGDDWRTRVQDDEKVWTVSTAWGANACTELAGLLAPHDEAAAAEWYDQARTLFAEVDSDGSLVADNGYLPEQLFDDGTADCATPLGWPHAIRLATVAELDAVGELD